MSSRVILKSGSSEICRETQFPKGTSNPTVKLTTLKVQDSPSLLGRVRAIPRDLLALFKDEEWMSCASDLFAASSHICSLTGTRASEFVPYLSIASAPFYLYHAATQSIEYFKLTHCAVKTARAADFFFWTAKGVGSFGTALGDIIKPFAGGATIIGLTKIPTVAFIFTYVFPAILIALSAFGGSSQGWALLRASYTLHTFKERKNSLGGSLINLENFLHDLQKPIQQGNTPQTIAQAKLDQKNYNQKYFNSEKCENELNSRVEALLHFRDLSEIRALHKTIEHLIPEMEKGIEVYTKAIYSNESLFQQIEESLEVSGRVLAWAQAWKGNKKLESALQELELRHQNILKIKSALYQEGLEITEIVREEITIKLAKANFSFLSSALNFTAGILFLLFQQHQNTAYLLALSGSVLGLTKVSISKIYGIDKEDRQTEPFLELLRKKELLQSQRPPRRKKNVQTV